MSSTTVVLNLCQARNDSGSLTPSLTGLVTLVVDTGHEWLTAYLNGRVLKRWPYKLLND
jgi:hypothetical protein